MTRFVAFLYGVMEFRSDITLHYDDLDDALWYDRGRDLAHRLTFRHWD